MPELKCVVINYDQEGEVMDNVTTVGIDLAKNVFSLHGVNQRGRAVLRKTVSRIKLAALVAQLPPCLIGLEACSGAHEWARRFSALGHEVRLMAPKFVAPYRKGGKNDDAPTDQRRSRSVRCAARRSA